jgi:hypothetical protein
MIIGIGTLNQLQKEEEEGRGGGKATFENKTSLMETTNFGNRFKRREAVAI